MDKKFILSKSKKKVAFTFRRATVKHNQGKRQNEEYANEFGIPHSIQEMDAKANMLQKKEIKNEKENSKNKKKNAKKA